VRRGGVTSQVVIPWVGKNMKTATRASREEGRKQTADSMTGGSEKRYGSAPLRQRVSSLDAMSRDICELSESVTLVSIQARRRKPKRDRRICKQP